MRGIGRRAFLGLGLLGLCLFPTSSVLSQCGVKLGEEGAMSDTPFHEISFSVPMDDGVVIQGTATLPPAMTAVIIPVHGSFPQTRDGDLDGSQTWMFPKGVPKRGLFRDIARGVYAQGIGVYRYDKRASGQSGGVYKDTDMNRLAQDVVAMAQLVQERHPEAKIVLLGQSEGGLTVLRAIQLGALHHAVVLQGPSLEPLEVFLAHQKTRAAAAFLDDKTGELASRFPYLSAFYQAMYRGDMLQRIQQTHETHYTLRLGDWSAETSLEKYRQYRWNGTEMLKGVTRPTLVLYGSEDANVRPVAGENIQALKTAQGLFPTVEVHILPGLEHSFRRVDPGDNFVTAMAKPLDPAYLDTLLSWFRRLISP